MKRIPAAPGRAVDFARSPPAGAFVGFVYYSALFPGRRLFPPVEQHSQHAAAGSQHQADPQRHIAAVPGLGAAGSRCRDGFSLHIFTDRTAALSFLLILKPVPHRYAAVRCLPDNVLPAVFPPRSGRLPDGAWKHGGSMC